MKFILRGLVAAMVVPCLAGALAGCGAGPNEGDVASTKGVAASNAPQSQADYYKQQQATGGAKPKHK